MKITKKLEGLKVRRSFWPKELWYRIKTVGKNIVVARNPCEREFVFILDHMENDWEIIPEEILERRKRNDRKID